MSRYDDIIDLPHPTSRRHARMSILDRAAQFSPFSALTGLEDMIEETGRITDAPIFMDDSAKAELNDALLALAARESERPHVRITYFHADEKKPGGAYVTIDGKLKRIDAPEQHVRLEDGTILPFCLITRIEEVAT